MHESAIHEAIIAAAVADASKVAALSAPALYRIEKTKQAVLTPPTTILKFNFTFRVEVSPHEIFVRAPHFGQVKDFRF